MRCIIKPATLAFFLACSMCCSAQQLVQNPLDIYKLCQKEDEFIGKPLSELLKELKPFIKVVFAEGGWAEKAPGFTFFFLSKKEFDSCRITSSQPLRLRVYLKEFFVWNRDARNKTIEEYLGWTKQDEEKFGHLTIGAIRVAGECQPCNNVPVTFL
jgi:hypothetical protein